MAITAIATTATAIIMFLFLSAPSNIAIALSLLKCSLVRSSLAPNLTAVSSVLPCDKLGHCKIQIRTGASELGQYPQAGTGPFTPLARAKGATRDCGVKFPRKSSRRRLVSTTSLASWAGSRGRFRWVDNGTVFACSGLSLQVALSRKNIQGGLALESRHKGAPGLGRAKGLSLF
jgi:hypothetical protein